MKSLKHISVLILSLLFVGGSASVWAQTNDRVPSSSEESTQSFDFAPGVDELQKNSSWWKARTESSPENRASWLGLYQTEYYNALKSEGKNFKEETQTELDQIEEKLKTLSISSYEYHAVAYQNRFMTVEGESHLNALNELRPNRIEWMDDLAAYAIFQGKTAQAKSYLSDLKKNGTYPFPLINYQRKTLQSLPPNAILLTHGNTDTYPLLILQMVDGLRKDVSVISVDHLNNANYREKMLEILGVESNEDISDEPYIALETLAEQANRPVFVSLTFPAFWLKGHAKNLYFKGLSYQWSPELAVFGGFGAMQFYLSQLRDLDLTKAHPVNRNYIPLLVKAMKEAKIAQNYALSDEIETKLRLIASQSTSPQKILNQIPE